MPTIDLTQEELQGLVNVLATASGPGINWMLTNALLTKLQAADQAAQKASQAAQGEVLPPAPRRKLNSEDKDHATLPGT